MQRGKFYSNFLCVRHTKWETRTVGVLTALRSEHKRFSTAAFHPQLVWLWLIKPTVEYLCPFFPRAGRLQTSPDVTQSWVSIRMQPHSRQSRREGRRLLLKVDDPNCVARWAFGLFCATELLHKDNNGNFQVTRGNKKVHLPSVESMWNLITSDPNIWPSRAFVCTQWSASSVRNTLWFAWVSITLTRKPSLIMKRKHKFHISKIRLVNGGHPKEGK